MKIFIILTIVFLNSAYADIGPNDLVPQGVPHLIRCSATTNDGISVVAYGKWVGENKSFSKYKIIQRDGVDKCLYLGVRVVKNQFLSTTLDVWTQVTSVENGRCVLEYSPEWMNVVVRVRAMSTRSDPAFGSVTCWKL